MKPFCTLGSKGKFFHGYMESGYIPGDELPEDESEEDKVAPNYDYILRRLDKLQAELIFVRKKLTEKREVKRKSDVPF